MSTATYNQNNSYQELDFRPFSLDYESSLKELGSKNQYWMEGVNKIQSAYSKITGLNPQWAKNKEALKAFNEQAKEQIKKIASTDLGVQGNAEQVNGVVAPLYDMTNPVSESIILDDYANKTGQSLVKTIESYKTKDKGIYYSPNNAKYALEWYQDYMKKASDPNASLDDLRKIKENVKGYTPYHDYSKELTDAITKCPENSTTTTESKNGYFIVNSSLTKDVGPCVETLLSPKALSQMDIDGYVQFGKNYQALGNTISGMNDKTINNYSVNLGKIAARLAIPGISEEEKTALTQQQDRINIKLNELNTLNSKLSSGDYSDIESNYGHYSGLAHRMSTINNLGKAFSKHSDKTEVEADPFALLQARLQHESIESERDRRFEAEQTERKEAGLNDRALLSAQVSLSKSDKSKQPVTELVSSGSATEEDDIKTDKESFLQSGQTIKNELNNVEQELFNYVYKVYGRNAKLDIFDKKQLESFVQGVIENDPRAKADQTIQGYLGNYENKRMAVDLWNNLYNNIQGEIKKEVGSDKVLVKTGEGNFLVPRSELNASVRTVSNLDRREGKSLIAQIFNPQNAGNVGISNSNLNLTPNMGPDQIEFDIFYDIKDKNGKIIRSVRVDNYNDIHKVYQSNEEIYKKHYKNSVTPNTLMMSNEAINLDPDNVFRNQLVSAFLPLTYKDGDKKDQKIIANEKDIRIGRTDWQGKVEISLPGIDKETGISVLHDLGYEASYSKSNKFIIKDAKEFVSPNADKTLPTIIKTSMEKISQTNYPTQQEIPIISVYKNKYKVFTTSGTPGKIFVQDMTKPNSIPYSTNNITEVTDFLLQLKRN